MPAPRVLESRELSCSALLSHEPSSPKLETPDPDLWPIHDGPHFPTEADALETLRLARSLLDGNSIPEEIWQSQRLVSQAVWRAAIREAARSQPSGVRMFRYVLAIAGRYDSEGIPVPSIPTPKTAPGSAPPVTKAHRDQAKLDRQRAVIEARRAQRSGEVVDAS